MKTIIPKLVAMTALTGLLAGCVQPNGAPDNTGTGALAGGASGAMIGALADRRDPGAGALIGGLAGLVAGGLIGHSVDQQQAAEQQAYTPPPPPPPPVPLQLEDIKALVRSGVADDVIITQINNTRSVYHLDANAIIDLSHAGVSQRVINYMINTPNTSVVSQAPPPPQTEVEVAAPGPGYTWVRGEWQWNGFTWVWIGGHWILPPRPYAVWVPAHWVNGPHGWYHEEGYWR